MPELESNPPDSRVARRRRHLKILGGVFLVVVLALGAMVAYERGALGLRQVSGGGPVQRLLAGVPQRGDELGSAAAPVRIVEFADLQCPVCGAFATGTLSALIAGPVRSGQARIDLTLLDIIGSDSRTANRGAYAAEQQGGLWQFADVFYRNQGIENIGYVNGAFLDGVAGQAGLNRAAFDRASASAAAGELTGADEALARSVRVTETPTFLMSGPGGQMRVVGNQPFSVFQAAIRKVS